MTEKVLPLWHREGISPSGSFHESLAFDGRPNREEARRAMVQARQLYSFRVALELLPARAHEFEAVIKNGTRALIRDYAQPRGDFAHTCDSQGRLLKATPELYTQAFGLFGLAQGQAIAPSVEIKAAAVRLRDYLGRERRLPSGGYSEIGPKGEILFQSNPHMHLFEAGLAWMEIDPDPRWLRFSTEVLELCLSRFIQPGFGLLAEHFDENWSPVRENGRFFFEPGHHFEWAWLMGRYQQMTGRDLSGVRKILMERAERHGIDPVRRAAWDQVWSDLTPKLRSSRFWPQCERAKAFSLAGRDGLLDPKEAGLRTAEALRTLFRYFDTRTPGLWNDTWSVEGHWLAANAKASSLYHIIGAISEGLKLSGR